MSAEFICRDAVPWLSANKNVGAIVTGLPDSDDLEMKLSDWIPWFTNAIRACMESASEKSCSIFCQTDRKINGQLISKSHLVFKAAELADVRCLWHKIILRREVGALDLYRPSFTHMIAFSRKLTSGTATPDVMLGGRILYPDGIGCKAAQFAVEFASRASTELVDPFCGYGTFVHAASAIGMRAIGIDIDPKQIENAEEQRGLF
jgi:hypothetical protein